MKYRVSDMVINKLILQTGIDIPFIPLAINIHQPTIKEIALIGGEETLYRACELLQVTVNDLKNKEDIKDLDKIKNFDIIMTMINSSDPNNLTFKVDMLKLFSLLFPNFSFEVTKKEIILRENDDDYIRKIDNNNFEELKEIIVKMFKLKENKDVYNPAGDLSAQLVKKFEERKKKLQELSNKTSLDEFDIFSRYISILNIGIQLDKNALSNYTVYQLFDTFNRYQLYHRYDLGTRIQLAGGKVDEENFPEGWQNWMQSLND